MFYFPIKTDVVDTQMNPLNDMVLLSIQNMLKLMGKKYLQFYAQIFCLSTVILFGHFYGLIWESFPF